MKYYMYIVNFLKIFKSCVEVGLQVPFMKYKFFFKQDIWYRNLLNIQCKLWTYKFYTICCIINWKYFKKESIELLESCTYHHIHKHITIIYRLFLSIHCVLIQRSSKQQKIAFQNGKAHTGVVDGKSTFSFFQPFVSIPNIFSSISNF